MKIRISLLAAALALLVGAAPVAACLATVHQAPPAERAHTGCDPAPDGPSATLCPDSGPVIPADGPVAAPAVVIGLAGAFHPGAALAPDPGVAGPVDIPPRARSAPIHLLHATFLI